MGAGAEELKYRFQWTFPIIISPHNPDVLYTTSQHVHRSTDEGMSWETISADLTRNDKEKQKESGGPITKDDTSVEYYNTIFTFVESPIQEGTFWAGSDDGLVHISRDNGKTWNNVTPKGLPETMISIIDASHHDAGTAYFAATRYKFNDFQPMIYKTTNYGKSWTKITNGIPAMDFTRVVREDPNKKGLLYAGTETGLYVSFDAGANWQDLQLNLPAVPVTDLAVHKRDKDLIVATQGRSFWVLDDLPVLHQMSDQIAKAENHLFQPEKTYLFGGPSFSRPGSTVGQNPERGAVFYYTLKGKVDEEIKLQILDPQGNEIRTYSSVKDGSGKPVKESTMFFEEEDQVRSSVIANEAGLNKFVWGLDYPDVTRIDGTQILWAGNTSGPDAIPGIYKVRMHIGDKMIAERSFEVIKDPRLTNVSQQDLVAQFELVKTVKAKLDTTHKTINRIRKVRKEVNEMMAEAKDNKELQEKAKAMLEAMSEIENELIQTKAESGQDVLNFQIKLNNKLAALASTIATGYGRPTQQQYAVFEELAGKVDAQFKRLQAVWDGEYENIIQEFETKGGKIQN